MTYNEYKVAAMKTATYPKDMAELYLDLGIHGEAGEVCDKFKKLIRDKGWRPGKDIAPADRQDILLELGDVMWYIANISVVFNVPMHFKNRRNISETDPDQNNLLRADAATCTVSELIKTIRSLHSEIDHGRNHLPWVVYAIAVIAHCLGSSLEEVCQMNIEKLRDRQERQALGGSGDHR